MKIADPLAFFARVITAVVGVIFLLGIWYLAKDGFFKGGGWLWPAIGGMLLLGMLPLFGLLAKHRNQGILVLWCRRFSESHLEVGKKNRWIWAVISEACRGIAVPVTIRDRSMTGSQSVGRSIQNPLSVVLIFIATPLWLWGMLWVLGFVDGSLPEFLVCMGGLVVYVFIFRGIAYLVGLVTTTMASHLGDPQSIVERLRMIRKKRWYRRELDALRCTDENWKDCISAVLGEVDFVIIDNIDSSKSIEWEIGQSISRLGTDRVVMLVREGTEVPSEVAAVFFDSERADQEIDSLHSTWGDDDFGEGTETGEYGKELSAMIRDKIAAVSSQSGPAGNLSGD